MSKVRSQESGRGAIGKATYRRNGNYRTHLVSFGFYKAIAEVKVEAINTDIALGQFDFRLERYRPQQNKPLQIPSVDKLRYQKIEEAKSQMSLLELWNKFHDYGLPKRITVLAFLGLEKVQSFRSKGLKKLGSWVDARQKNQGIILTPPSSLIPHSS